MNTVPPELEDWLSLIRGELSEAPGLRFTPAEAARRWEIDDSTLLGAILDALVFSGMLYRDDNGYLVARRMDHDETVL